MLSIVLSIVVGGMLGHAIDAGYDGRLAQYINSPDSYAIKLFSPEVIAQGKGGWQGEHAGKWMYAASKAYELSGSHDGGLGHLDNGLPDQRLHRSQRCHG